MKNETCFLLLSSIDNTVWNNYNFEVSSNGSRFSFFATHDFSFSVSSLKEVVKGPQAFWLTFPSLHVSVFHDRILAAIRYD